jgi:hypothetical protein
VSTKEKKWLSEAVVGPDLHQAGFLTRQKGWKHSDRIKLSLLFPVATTGHKLQTCFERTRHELQAWLCSLVIDVRQGFETVSRGNCRRRKGVGEVFLKPCLFGNCAWRHDSLLGFPCFLWNQGPTFLSPERESEELELESTLWNLFIQVGLACLGL